MFYFMRFYWVLFLAFYSCAVPCPRDKKITDINFTAPTRNWLTTVDKLKTMTFVNTEGKSISFVLPVVDMGARDRVAVETLCERGDFLDKTTQVRYYDAQGIHVFAQSDDQRYTLALDARIANYGQYGNPQDTIFVEDINAWAQRIKEPNLNGGVTIVTNARKNESHPSVLPRIAEQNFRILADTIINGRQIKNCITQNLNNNADIHIFYTAANGFEAFTTKDGETWVRKD
jgi:hypothetical protein